MFSLDTIDVAIGLALLFLILSLLCTSIREAIEGLMKTRASDLERGVRQLLQDDGELTERLYQHPLIYSLFAGDYQRPNARKLLRRGGDLPSYIPANQFARALIDMVHQGAGAYSPYAAATPPLTLASVREAATQFPNANIRRAVLSAIDHAQGDLETARRNIENWFDGSMDRVSGWYKRRTQLILFGIGLALAVGLNVDAITVTQRLQQDKALRAVVVARAEAITRQATSVEQLAGTPEKLAGQLGSYGFPLGWKGGWPAPQMAPCQAQADKPCRSLFKEPVTQEAAWTSILSPGAVLQMLIGWLITAIALTLGAPFWFDVLNRMMVIRSTVKPTEKSPDEGSEDRPKRAPEDDDPTGPAAVGVAPAPVRAATAVPPTLRPALARTPAGFPFVPNQWTDDKEEGLA